MVELECSEIRECSDEIIAVLSNLFSENYGIWETTGKRVKLSSSRFKELHQLDTVVYMLSEENEILGFMTYGPENLINCLVVKEKYRRKQVASTLVEWLYFYSKEPISIITRNPISVHILEKYKVGECRKIKSNFPVSQKDLPRELLEKCESRYGKLEYGEEWKIKIKRERN